MTLEDKIAPMSKDEFIAKAKALLMKIDEVYTRSFHDKPEEESCERCGGMLYIEQGGEVVDCTSCKGTGNAQYRVFDREEFSDAIEHEIMFGEQPFFELIGCEII